METKMLVVRSNDRRVATSLGKLATNSFGYAFCYTVANGATIRIGRTEVELPDDDICLYDTMIGQFRPVTEWESNYIEFRELSHDEKVIRLVENPELGKFLVGYHR